MKYAILPFMLLLLLCSNVVFSQEVTTLTNVTANGGVTLDADGNLYVAHFGPLPFVSGQEGRNIYKITPTGEVSLFVENELNVGSGNHIDSQGFLYQSNFLGSRIFKINTSGDVVDHNFASISGPVGITVIENDTLVICECNTGSLKKVTPDGNTENFLSSVFFACANGITVDDEGIIYTTNFNDGRINRVTKQGDISTIGSTPFGNGHITYRSLDQHLYIASYSDNRIYKMDLDGNVSLLAGNGSAGAVDSTDPLAATFSKPNGIEISHDGCSLYVTQDENVIREIKLNDHGCTTSTKEVVESEHIVLYPNPSPGKVFYKSGKERFEKIQILDISGRLLKEVIAKDDGSIDISSFSSGSYLIQFITSEHNIYLKKIILE